MTTDKIQNARGLEPAILRVRFNKYAFPELSSYLRTIRRLARPLTADSLVRM